MNQKSIIHKTTTGTTIHRTPVISTSVNRWVKRIAEADRRAPLGGCCEPAVAIAVAIVVVLAAVVAVAEAETWSWPWPWPCPWPGHAPGSFYRGRGHSCAGCCGCGRGFGRCVATVNVAIPGIGRVHGRAHPPIHGRGCGRGPGWNTAAAVAVTPCSFLPYPLPALVRVVLGAFWGLGINLASAVPAPHHPGFILGHCLPVPEMLVVALAVCGHCVCGQSPCIFGKAGGSGVCRALGGQGEWPRSRMLMSTGGTTAARAAGLIRRQDWWNYRYS